MRLVRYVKLTYGGIEQTSKTVTQTLNPAWNQTLRWSVSKSQLDKHSLEMNFFDYDMLQSVPVASRCPLVALARNDAFWS